jgi:hypothetical protein
MSPSQTSPSFPTPDARLLKSASPSGYAGLLRLYFTSGWLFLVPYLLVYLLYYAKKWPANSVPGETSSFIPPLLYVYWGLHAVHLGLAACALPASCRSRTSTAVRIGGAMRSEALSRWAPWIALALVFYIPGVYLEFPTDPWMHLGRINEWASHALVGSHSAGYKSFYFFAYSLVGWIPAAHQLAWLDVYHTAVCLLLCWQYFLLARETGLERRWALLAVFVNVLIFGNVCFSFFRYYSLASTLYAQIGVIALIRIGLRTARQIGAVRTKGKTAVSIWSPEGPVAGAGAILLLLPLIGANHVQGLGMAALGLFGIIAWRLIEHRRLAIVWIAVGLLLASWATVAWWPRSAGFGSLVRPHGWLSAWYGFNLFDFTSPAADRMMQIFGIFGLCNLAAGLILWTRNRIAGWLTVAPVLVLILPCGAIPLADAIVRGSGSGYLITYHRMFYAVPFGLATATLVQSIAGSARWGRLGPETRSGLGFVSLLALLVACATVPASGPWFNRLWHVTVRSPDDLALRPIWDELARRPQPAEAGSLSRVASTTAVVHTLFVQQAANDYIPGRRTASAPEVPMAPRLLVTENRSPSDDFAAWEQAFSRSVSVPISAVVTLRPDSFFTPYSLAAFASRHWPAQEALMATAGMPELETFVNHRGFSAMRLGDHVTLHVAPPVTAPNAPK